MTTSTTASVLDQICQFFGGPYDATTHTYHTPTVAGLTVVRRGFAKRTYFEEFFLNAPVGTQTGCILVAQITGTRDHRVALPAIQGRRKVHYPVELHGFLWSKAGYVEDGQDFGYALRDAMVAKIRTDPTLGSGGIENPAGTGFQAGEGSEDGGGEIVTEINQWVTEDEASRGYMSISFEAHAYDVA